MKKIGRITRSIIIFLITVTVIVSLIYSQHKYSSKTEYLNDIEYQGVVSINKFYDVLIFEYSDNLIGFKDENNSYRWLNVGNKYDVEYKDVMWHRSDILFVNYEVSSEDKQEDKDEWKTIRRNQEHQVYIFRNE